MIHLKQKNWCAFNHFFQTLNTISAEKNSTIVFPLPIDLITYFLKSRDEAWKRRGNDMKTEEERCSSSDDIV